MGSKARLASQTSTVAAVEVLDGIDGSPPPTRTSGRCGAPGVRLEVWVADRPCAQLSDAVDTERVAHAVALVIDDDLARAAGAHVHCDWALQVGGAGCVARFRQCDDREDGDVGGLRGGEA
jgi:hypothetical protein